jgi:hypothetical protein
MTSYLKFDPQSSEQIAQHGLTFEWCASLFLGGTKFESIPTLLQGISAEQKQFAVRQTLATDTIYLSLQQQRLSVADPWAAGKRCEALACLTADKQDSLPYEMLPIYYGCKSENGEQFWVCVYSTCGVVTQAFFPSRDLVIFDVSRVNAESVVGSLQSFLSRYSEQVAELVARVGRPAKCVGLLDMVTNFGHQAINHLSGIQRIVDFGLLGNIDEVWACGTLFFGRVELLFPELNGRVRYFSSRWEIAGHLLREPCQLIRIGSTYLSSKLRDRIARKVRPAADRIRSNLLVVTLRAAGRTCVNLPDVVGELYERLRKNCDFKIALDGWVLPESSIVAASSVGAAISSQYVDAIRNEMALAREIERKLPPGVIIANTIGRSMFESLDDLAVATCYFSHVGTLQHKLGLLLRLPGVVHGPKLQLAAPEGGPYLSEDGMSPIFVPQNAVEDAPSTPIRGQSFADYRIVDLAFITESLARLMRPPV